MAGTGDYTPRPETLAPLPEISGNKVNGLGETEVRRPTPFFWHPPERQTHGAMQAYTMRQLRPKNGEDFSFRNPAVDRGPKPGPVAPEKQPGDAAYWTARVKAFGVEQGGDEVAITPMRDLYVYEGYSINEPNLILIAVQHRYEDLSKAPSNDEDITAYRDVQRQYARGARAAHWLTNFIRDAGYNASPWPGPMADALNMIPAAIAAGLGELGKHGSMIHRRFGAGFRLAAVSTDMPLHFDSQDVFGADDFCLNCQVCSNACPPGAIGDAKQMVRGEERWYVDFDKCIPYFAENYSCAVCIAVCPWTRPGIADRLVTKMAARNARKQAAE